MRPVGDLRESSFLTNRIQMSEPHLNVATQLEIAATKGEIFDAIVNPERMSCYFTTQGSGRLDGGQPVVWSWSDCGAELTVTPQEIETDRRVSFLWCASGVETSVVIEIEDGDAGGCVVKVSESDWPRDDEGIARSLQQMQGWMHMLCCMKAYLEHGINLRVGASSC